MEKERKKLLITCPPMIGRIEQYDRYLREYDYFIPPFTQVVEEERLIELVPQYDAWIAGDDPATERVIRAGRDGRLRTIVKWGIGVDNIDREAIKKYDIKFSNTPAMFGDEVSNVAIGYLLALTRCLYRIDTEVRNNNWYKPSGTSLRDKKVALIGFGNIGRSIARRLLVLGTNVYVYDPGFIQNRDRIDCDYDSSFNMSQELYDLKACKVRSLETCLSGAKVVILSCPLLESTRYLINRDSINLLSDNCYIVNVSRGPIVNEKHVLEALNSGKIKGFATDVFEEEPIDPNHPFLRRNDVILGSHNASNTEEAVDRTSFKAIKLLEDL